MKIVCKGLPHSPDNHLFPINLFNTAVESRFKVIYPFKAKISSLKLTIEGILACHRQSSTTKLHAMALKSATQKANVDIPIKNHLNVYMAAEKLGIAPLRTLAAKRIVSWARDEYNRSQAILLLQNAVKILNKPNFLGHELIEALAEVTAMYLLDLNTHPELCDLVGFCQNA